MSASTSWTIESLQRRSGALFQTTSCALSSPHYTTRRLSKRTTTCPDRHDRYPGKSALRGAQSSRQLHFQGTTGRVCNLRDEGGQVLRALYLHRRCSDRVCSFRVLTQ